MTKGLRILTSDLHSDDGWDDLSFLLGLSADDRTTLATNDGTSVARALWSSVTHHFGLNLSSFLADMYPVNVLPYIQAFVDKDIGQTLRLIRENAD